MVKRVLGLLTCFTLVLTFSFISKPLGVHAQTPLIGFIVLTGSSMDSSTKAFIQSHFSSANKVIVFGGPGVVKDSTIKGEKPRVVFMENDTNNGFVKLGMSIDELRALYGKETDMEYQDIQTDGNVYTTLAYPFGKFEFSADEYNPNSFLYWVTITSSDFVGPRDIRVGDKTDSVLENFPDGNYDVKKQKDGTTVRILYGGTWPDKYYGVIDYEGDQMTQIRCSEGGPGFGSYGLTFVIKDGKVASFNYGVCII